MQVLCHLPLHKASPENMSAILQSVNGLRFYRTSGVISLKLKCCVAFIYAKVRVVISSISLSDLKIRHIKQGKRFAIKMDQVICENPSYEETKS